MDDTMPIKENKEKRTISRRTVIAGGAVGAAAVWTVPLIASTPAYGAPVTGSTITTACSYFELVYTKLVNGILVYYADRVGPTGACEGNTGSADVNWCWTCGTDKYDNQGDNSGIRRNNGPLKLPSSGCIAGDHTFNVNGNTIMPGPGVTIVFAMAAAGNLNSTTGQEPGPASGDTCASSPGVAKVNVACGPLSSASFSCLPS